MLNIHDKQASISLDIQIKGFDDWKIPFNGKKEKLDSFWTARLGKSEVPFYDWVQAVARINNQTIEEALLFGIMRHGFVLDELEIEFNHPEYSKWGRCAWLKEHGSYSCENHRLRKLHGSDISPVALSLVSSVFATEHAGEQTVSLVPNAMFSMALAIPERERVLFAFRKDIIFHKTVFSPSSEEVDIAA